MHSSQKLINHVALVLDASSSMTYHSSKLVAVADEQIKHLAFRSEELGQETRVSVYTFNQRVECVIFDMDVMRLPSIKDLYRANGMTALVDATIKSQKDLATTSQIYGDHAFLTFVLTDGIENASKTSWRDLASHINGSDNWTVGFLVPNSDGVTYLTRIGIDVGHISVWDATSANGIIDSFSTIRTVTENFMVGRATGQRGLRNNMFSTGVDAVNASTVKSLVPLTGFKKYNVLADTRIDVFVTSMLGIYVPGNTYYQLVKREIIQPQKKILVLDKRTGKVYGGPDARGLIGLPNEKVKVSPDDNPDYEIYVQSTSLNRILRKGTSILVK